jgi:catechol 2,3-dioxygenase-like lactoylglutathione lyase family enzyme
MPLHQLKSIRIGVPDPSAVESFYVDWGLTKDSDGVLSTTDGGRQLFIEHAAKRSLLELALSVDDADDLDAIARRLSGLGVAYNRRSTGDVQELTTAEPVSGLTVRVQVAPRARSTLKRPAAQNQWGRTGRSNVRAEGITRSSLVHPRKLGHVVMASTDEPKAKQFFVDGIGFKVSDVIKGRASFLRCSSDHHNLLVVPGPACYLQHTAWEVDDVDEVGRGAMAIMEKYPSSHVWGMGRHFAGSNFFWYLKDPAGNFCEYYSDMDAITDEAAWTPAVLEGPKSHTAWGPSPPQCMYKPDDLSDLMPD